MKLTTSLLVCLLFLGCGGGSSDGVSSSTWYKPDVNTTWQWQLTGVLNTSYPVDLYDVDLFDTDAIVIDTLHAQGKKVICYFSAGSYENWRPDEGSFDLSLLGNNLDGWVGEKWLDISSSLLEPIMKTRLDLAVSKGCDGVEPDNIDGYTNNTGFALSSIDQINYNKFLANEAHSRGLAIGLKNDVDQVDTLLEYFDFAINEECHEYNECDKLYPFIQNNKPVFNAEYQQDFVDNSAGERDLMCTNSIAEQFQTLVLPLNLDDSFRISCN